MKRMVESEIADILNEKLQIDENGIDLKDNLHVDGKISGGEIVEDMKGYSFEAASDIATGITITYAEIVKTGNKLTLAVALSVLLPEAINLGTYIGTFTVPESVGDLLVPFNLGGTNYLDVKDTPYASSGVSTVSSKSRLMKHTSTQLKLNIRLENFVANTQYYGRYECTFLLSDNLAA